MDKNIALFIMKIGAYSSLLPLTIGLWNHRRLKHAQFILILLVGTAAFFEFFSLLIGRWGLKINNLFLLHIYTVIEFIILSTIFRYQLKPLFSNTFFIVLVATQIVVSVANAFLLETPLMFNDYAHAWESLMLIFLVLCYFYKTLNELKTQHLEQEPIFWLSVGVLLYFSGSLFIFIFSNYFISSNEAMFTAWGIHATFSILLNIFYSIALWVNPKPQI